MALPLLKTLGRFVGGYALFMLYMIGAYFALGLVITVTSPAFTIADLLWFAVLGIPFYLLASFVLSPVRLITRTRYQAGLHFDLIASSIVVLLFYIFIYYDCFSPWGQHKCWI